MTGSIKTGGRRMAGARRRAQRGAVAILVAFSLLAMIALVGFVVDLGRAFVVHSRMQIAADACALAGIARLDRTRQGGEDAFVAGKTIALRNLDGTIATVAASDPTVQVLFGTTLGPGEGNFSVKGAVSDWASIKYVRCKVENNALTASGLLEGMTSFSTGATATSEMLGTVEACAVPMAACARETAAGEMVSPPSGVSTSDPNWVWGLQVGQWITPPPSGGGSTGLTGNFGWATLGGGVGSPSLEGEMENGVCNIDFDRVMRGSGIGTPGNRANVDRAWNTRLGIYQSNYGACSNLTAPGPTGTKPAPDKTGYGFRDYLPQTEIVDPYNPAATIKIYNIYNRVGGTVPTAGAPENYLKARELFDPYQRAVSGSECKLDSVQLAERNKSRRLVVMPVIKCSDWATASTNAQVKGWLCGLIVDEAAPGAGGSNFPVEVIGRADIASSPCGTVGIPTRNVTAGRVPALVQ